MRQGHVKVLWRERLEKLRELLWAAGGRMSLRELGRRYGVKKWEVRQAEVLGWVRIETVARVGPGPRERVVCLERDTRKARPVLEEWEVPLAIPAKIRAFAERTLEIVKRVTTRGVVYQFRSCSSAYWETYPKFQRYEGVRSSAARLFRRGDVQAVRAWMLARARGLVGADEAMPESVEEIEWRLQEAGWTDADTRGARRNDREAVRRLLRQIPDNGEMPLGLVVTAWRAPESEAVGTGMGTGVRSGPVWEGARKKVGRRESEVQREGVGMAGAGARGFEIEVEIVRERRDGVVRTVKREMTGRVRSSQ